MQIKALGINISLTVTMVASWRTATYIIILGGINYEQQKL
ncbi:hypothetical protein NBRC111893_1683 [Lentilactobacillus kosonis]|uniref:Uncharacterized protein n=1 Tax=Lentilactobacillus kosonis TaxID=2810561 RepID=A0A401FMG7_9LACO|nr:hypothetical protein NBRC111893_1683 [Lentilactobacillus kosonis]